ncbi:MAG: NAD(+)/NADH kinase, partial [Bacteroidia bacterium]|nr:NAD(+)/NADH kinase [Bacteroidia bacterium]
MKLAIFGKPTQKTDIQALKNFFDYAEHKNIVLFIHDFYYQFLKDKFYIHQPKIFYKIEEVIHCDYLFCFGGDGTIIDAVHFIGNYHLPILGVNVGRLGFLATANLQDLPLITEQLLHNAGIIEERTMLEAITEPDLI